MLINKFSNWWSIKFAEQIFESIKYYAHLWNLTLSEKIYKQITIFDLHLNSSGYIDSRISRSSSIAEVICVKVECKWAMAGVETRDQGVAITWNKKQL